MRIGLDDSDALPAKNIIYLNDQLIRFQFKQARQPSPYQEFFTGIYSSPSQVLPKAPNREAIESNLNSLAHMLEVHCRICEEPFGERGVIESRLDLLLLQIDHFCRTDYLYTNGQAIVSGLPKAI